MKSTRLKFFSSTYFKVISYFLFFSSVAVGQDISFTAEAPKAVRTGEQFQLTYTLNDDVDEFTPPSFGEFKYLGGPYQGTSTSINMVNGRTSRTTTFTFAYYLQAPSKVGRYNIEPAIARHKKGEIKSNSLSIDVAGSGQSSTSGSNQTQGGQTGAGTANTSASDNIYIRLEYDKSSAYVGEQITAWIKLYTQVDISGIDQQFKGPEFIGFYQQDVELPPISLQREKVGDDVYSTALIKKVVLYPQKAGEITIEPFELLVEVQKQSRRHSQSIFDDFFGPQYERARMNLTSKSVKFTIKPLPANQPAGFTGAVGKFQISGSANPTLVKTNDAVTLKATITGKGNLKLIDNVKSNFPPTFDVFDPIRKAQLDKSTLGKSGKVSFEYTAIPRHPGTFVVSPFSLVYFDPEIKEYITLTTQSFEITVAKGEGDTTTVVSGNLSKEDIELLGSDIRYIETKTRLHPRSRFIFGSLWFFASFVIIFLMFLAILLIRRERIRRSSDMASYRNRRASRVANKRLRKAQQLLKENRKKEFYDELEQALWKYLADKLRIPFSELSKDRATEEFKHRFVSEELTQDFFNLIQSCEIARFAPGGMESEMSDILNRSAAIVNKLDQSL
jgi:hypothetical protein